MPMENPGHNQSVAHNSSDCSPARNWRESAERLETLGGTRDALASAIRDSVHNPNNGNTLLCLKSKLIGTLNRRPTAYAISVTDTGWCGAASYSRGLNTQKV